MTFRLSPVAALVALAFSQSAAAEPAIALDPVVVSGSRVEHSSFDLPAAVEAVGADRIGADQARVNASEALVAVPGLTIQNRQNYAQDLQISSRGFGARSAFGVRGVRLVADGIPASMPDGQGQVASFNLDRAERIEVMRGPLSAIYGNHAGGVIQLFTPDGKGAPSVEGNFAAGSFGMWKADVAAQGEKDGVGYVLDTSRFSTDGYRDHSAATRNQSQAKLTFHPSEDGKLTLLASTFHQEAQDPQGLDWASYQANPRGVSGPTAAYNTRKTIDQTQGGITYEHRFGEQTVSLSAYAGQRSVIQYQSIPKSVQTASTKQAGGIIDFDRAYAGFDGRWTGRYDVAGGRLTTTVGIDYEEANDDRRGWENFIGSTLGVMGKLRRSENDRVATFDQYAQAEWQGERWNFSGGVRHSHVAFKVDDNFLSNGNDGGSISYDKTTPTLAALYKLTPAVNLYASAARGFETPTMNELFYSGPGGTFSYTLQPATSVHLETGVKAYVGDDSRLDIALFQVNTDNELVVAGSSGGRTSYRNASKTERTGVEIALDSRWAHDISSRVAYTQLDAHYAEAFGAVPAGNKLPGVAGQTLFAELAWRHPASGFHAAVEGLARSKVYVEDSNTAQAAPAYAIANLRFGIDRQYGATKLSSFVRFDNIFDRQYVGSVIVGDGNGRYYESAPGRTWLAGVSVRHSF